MGWKFSKVIWPINIRCQVFDLQIFQCLMVLDRDLTGQVFSSCDYLICNSMRSMAESVLSRRHPLADVDVVLVTSTARAKNECKPGWHLDKDSQISIPQHKIFEQIRSPLRATSTKISGSSTAPLKFAEICRMTQ